MKMPGILGCRVVSFRQNSSENPVDFLDETEFAVRSPLTTRSAFLKCLNSGAPLKYPVVLIRGLGRSSGFWLDFPNYLARFSNVILMDLLGTGMSPHVLGRHSMKEFGADILGTLRKFDLLPCHLVGISLGGMAAVEAVRQASEENVFPEALANNFASLTVLASSARFTGEKRISPLAITKMLIALRSRIPKNHEFAEFLVSVPFLQKRRDIPQIWDKIWADEGFNKIAVLRQLFAAACFHGQESFEKIRRPSMFVVSKEDGLVSWRNTPRLWEKIAGSELRILEGIGHDLTTEKPAETADFIRKFCERVENLS